MKELFNKYQTVIIAILGVLFAVFVVVYPEVDGYKADFVQTAMWAIAVFVGAMSVRDFGVALAVKYDFAVATQTALDAYEARTGVDIPDGVEAAAVIVAGTIDAQLEAEDLKAVG